MTRAIVGYILTMTLMGVVSRAAAESLVLSCDKGVRTIIQ